MAAYVKAMEDVGYAVIEGVRVYPNGDVAQEGAKANIREAARNGRLVIGLHDSNTRPYASGEDPYEISIGNNGVGTIPRRIGFRLTKDQDVVTVLLSQLEK